MPFGAITGRSWTDEDKAKLRELWPSYDLATIAERLNRTRNATETRARRMGLTRPVAPSWPWTINQDAVLRELWPQLGIAVTEIAGKIGRTRNAVIGRARRLGLVFRTKPTSTVLNGEIKKPKPRKRPKRAKGAGIIFGAPGQRTPPTPIQADPYVPGTGVGLMEAQYGHCRAVIQSSHDNNGLAIFCGEPRSPLTHYSFCEYHRQRYTRPR